MASNGKKKTTMAKLNREHRLRERRLDKQARKDERKRNPGMEEVVEEVPFDDSVLDRGTPMLDEGRSTEPVQ